MLVFTLTKDNIVERNAGNVEYDVWVYDAEDRLDRATYSKPFDRGHATIEEALTAIFHYLISSSMEFKLFGEE